MAKTVENPTVEMMNKHSVRVTPSRKAILKVFVKFNSALSQPDLERHFKGVYDRVTIYRTLNHFLEKGILHKIPDDAGAARYALCPEACTEDTHAHEHVHFKCMKCGLTSCFEDIHVPHLKLPTGFKPMETNMIIQGICRKCGLS